MMEQKNVLLAIVISAIILIGFEYVLPQVFPHYFHRPMQTTSSTTTSSTPTGGTTVQPAVPAAPTFKPRAEAIAGAPRVAIHSDQLIGTISLVGGRLDDLT